MLNRYLRIGLCSLLLLLALPVSAEGETTTTPPEKVDSALICGDKTLDKEKGQVCLRWFSPGGENSSEDLGASINVVFDTKDLESVCKKDLKCFVDNKDGKPLKDCNGGIDPANVFFFEDAYRVEGQSPFIVSCTDGEGLEAMKKSEKSERKDWNCRLVNSGAIWKKWPNGPLLPDEKVPADTTKIKKAIPWDGKNAYCPDPSPTGAINAYTLLVPDKGTTLASPDIVKRYLLQNCSRVVKYYHAACSEFASKKLNVKQKKKDLVNKTLTERKKEMIAQMLGLSECNNVCNTEWTKLSKATRDFFFNGLSSIKSERMQSKLDVSEMEAYLIDDRGISADPAKALAKWFQQNDYEWSKSEEGQLGDYLAAKAKKAWAFTEESNKTVKTAETNAHTKELMAAQAEYQKKQEIVSFLNKRYLNLQMHYTLSDTQTYDVSNILRRSDKSTETDLALFDQSKKNQVNIIDKIIRLIAQVLGSFGVLLLIISGVTMIVSQGEETMLQKAKQTFLYTLIGLIVAFMSYTIVRFIIELLLTR